LFSGEVGDTCFDQKKKSTRVSVGFTRVNRVLDRSADSTGFCRANSLAGFYLDLDRSQARVGRVSGRPVGLGFKTMSERLNDIKPGSAIRSMFLSLTFLLDPISFESGMIVRSKAIRFDSTTKSKDIKSDLAARPKTLKILSILFTFVLHLKNNLLLTA
jgi:hypothetical protein